MSGLGGNAVLANGTATAPQTFTGFNKFDELTKFEKTRPQFVATAQPTNPTDTDFITKADGEDLFGTITGNAQLSGGVTEAEPQIFTGFNEFENTTKFTNTIRVQEGDGTNDDPEILMTAPAGYANLFQQNSTRLSGTGSSNRILQVANQTNEITQQSTGNQINKFIQYGANSVIETDGTIEANGSITTGTTATIGQILNISATQPTLPSNMVLRCRGGMFIDGGSGMRIPRGGVYDNPGLREWWINSNISSGTGTGALNYLYSSNVGSGGSGVFITKHRLNPNGSGQWASSIQGFQPLSDDRLKTNEAYLENATESLLKLSVQTYDKEKVNNFSLLERTGKKVRETGLIAQEVYYNAPEFRHLINCGTEYDDDEYPEGKDIIPDEMDLSGVPIGEDPDYEEAGWSKTEMASIEYQGFVAYLIKSNQELHERISILEAKINNM